MPASMNHHSLNVKEVIRGHSGRDGPVHSTPERCIRAQDGKPPTPASSAHLPPSHGTRRGPTVTSTTANLPSSSSKLSSSSPSSSSSTSSSSTLAPPSVAGAPSRFSVKSPGKSEEVRESTQTRVNSSHSSTQQQRSEESSSSEVESSRVKTVVPASPPTARSPLSVTQQAQPLGPSRLSKIRQNHLATKKREQMKARSMKLPELAEHSELDTTTVLSPPAVTNGSSTLPGDSAPPSSSSFKGMPQISVTDEDAEMPPPPTDEPVTPSLPEAFLKKLGLAVNSSSDGDKDNDVSVDQLPEKEIESKFVSLSLAFKTDKLTLDQRVSVQERSRDLAEQNVDRELQGLREAVEALSELVSDDQVRSVLQKIKQHIDVLEQSAARVSSRAEVYGAVQQERRMCKAMEVMVLYTENLRRIREREESELQEARKVLSERAGNGYNLDVDSGPGRRSMSVCGFNASGRPMRRRSEVALPRVLGGSGSPSMTPGASLDPKSRFQSAVASTSMQHVVTNTMRRASLEKQRSVSMSSAPFSPVSAPSSPFSLKTSPPTLSVTKEVDGDSGTAEGSGEKKETVSTRKISQEEDAFRKGFEEGLKTKLSQELNDLRDQQNSISQNLEHVMDKVDQSQLEDEEYLARPSRLETTLAIASKVKDHVLQYDWRSNKKAIRNIAGVFFVLLAFFIVYLSPPISTVDVQHFPKPPQ